MKNFRCLSLSLLSLLFVGEALGQQSYGSGQMGSSALESMKPLEYSKSPPQKAPTQSLPPPVQLPQPIPQRAEYLHPGILVFFNGKWEGSDHLLNLTNNIGVNISIVKPESEVIGINEVQIQKEVEAIFGQANIHPQTLALSGKPPLPVFEIEIFIYPIERGYVACCGGRLFESVTLERFKMDPNMAFQAITWEKQQLIVSPTAQFAEQLIKVAQEIATAFAERFQAYERFKRGGQ